MIRIGENEFRDIVAYVREEYGINLEKKKILVECRLSKELEHYHLDSFQEYINMLRRDKTGKIASEMVNSLTTNYTYFMREAEHFNILEQEILPDMVHNRKNSLYRIWCAGCSSGEECYTLAMKLREFKEQVPNMPRVSILATDIAEEVLHQAREGIYPIAELGGLPEEWQKKYCMPAGEEHFRVDPKLKQDIQFRVENLMKTEERPEQYDLILCRNVMIYFDKESKRKLIRQFEKCLKPGGYLFVGHSEMIPKQETSLSYVCSAVYRKS